MTASVRPHDPRSLPNHRWLGQILTAGGFITHQDLGRALVEQARSGRRLGEILCDMDALDPGDLQAALLVQQSLSSTRNIIKLAAGTRKPLGELLLCAKRITQGQLDSALEVQQRTGEKLGEVLVRRNLLSQAELDSVLAFQAAQEVTDEDREGPLRLGALLVAAGEISQAQLDEAVAFHRETNKRIGDVLVELGHVKPQTIEYGLGLQHRLMTVALSALLGLSAATVSDEAYAKDASSQLRVSAEVQAYAKLDQVRQAAHLEITQADIDRGYVDVPAGSQLGVKTNSRNGYMLVFDSNSDIFRGIRVSGAGGDAEIGSGGGSIIQRSFGGSNGLLQLGYRFELAQNAQPGRYPWPLQVSVRPL